MQLECGGPDLVFFLSNPHILWGCAECQAISYCERDSLCLLCWCWIRKAGKKQAIGKQLLVAASKITFCGMDLPRQRACPLSSDCSCRQGWHVNFKLILALSAMGWGSQGATQKCLAPRLMLSIYSTRSLRGHTGILKFLCGLGNTCIVRLRFLCT